MNEHNTFSQGELFAYERPDHNYGYMRIIKSDISETNSRRIVHVQTFGEPTLQIITDPLVINKMSVWKRTSFWIYEERLLELKLTIVGNLKPTETELKESSFTQQVGSFDSLKFIWLDID